MAAPQRTSPTNQKQAATAALSDQPAQPKRVNVPKVDSPSMHSSDVRQPRWSGSHDQSDSASVAEEKTELHSTVPETRSRTSSSHGSQSMTATGLDRQSLRDRTYGVGSVNREEAQHVESDESEGSWLPSSNAEPETGDRLELLLHLMEREDSAMASTAMHLMQFVPEERVRPADFLGEVFASYPTPHRGQQETLRAFLESLSSDEFDQAVKYAEKAGNAVASGFRDTIEEVKRQRGASEAQGYKGVSAGVGGFLAAFTHWQAHDPEAAKSYAKAVADLGDMSVRQANSEEPDDEAPVQTPKQPQRRDQESIPLSSPETAPPIPTAREVKEYDKIRREGSGTAGKKSLFKKLRDAVSPGKRPKEMKKAEKPAKQPADKQEADSAEQLLKAKKRSEKKTD